MRDLKGFRRGQTDEHRRAEQLFETISVVRIEATRSRAQESEAVLGDGRSELGRASQDSLKQREPGDHESRLELLDRCEESRNVGLLEAHHGMSHDQRVHQVGAQAVPEVQGCDMNTRVAGSVIEPLGHGARVAEHGPMLERHQLASSGRARARQYVSESRIARFASRKRGFTAAKRQREQARRAVMLGRHVDLGDSDTVRGGAKGMLVAVGYQDRLRLHPRQQLRVRFT